MLNKSILSLLLAGVILVGCNSKPEPIAIDPSPIHPEWTANTNIYEVNVRQYTPEGTFNAFAEHLPRLQEMGVDILWFMPVQPIGVARRKGELGSYYSISDYRGINPEFGTHDDFHELVMKIHELGMKVIIDWVPNHTAWDHYWMEEHPDFYYIDPETGEISNGRNDHNQPTDWTDVAELDYNNPEMQHFMIEDMRFWIEEHDIDGFRCDMAGGQTEDFWRRANEDLRNVKRNIFMLAESNFPVLHDCGFNASYAWEFHHLLNKVARGEAPVSEIEHYIHLDAKRFPQDAMRMMFIDNHDENSWNGTVESRLGPNAQAAFALALTMPNSIPLIYSGQEVSLNHSLEFFQRDTINWDGPSQADFYSSMLTLKSTQPALRNGDWGGAYHRIEVDHPRCFAVGRHLEGNTVVTLVNFSGEDLTVNMSGVPKGKYVDWVDGETANLGIGGADIDIPANSYMVLVRN